MSQITTNPTSPALAPEVKPPEGGPAAAPQIQKKPRTAWDHVKRILTPIASLRLTVVLFALSLFLVFAGTLAQAESGNLTVIHQYFRSPTIVWIPFQVFVRFAQVFSPVSIDEGLIISGAFPYPGGWLLGGLLLANLLAAHLIRFKMTWKRSGIFLIHSGLVVMMLSELVTGLYAVEGTMTLVEGETASFIDHNHRIELAIINRADPKTDDVVVIPQALVQAGGKIAHRLLPFDLVVEKYMVNSTVPTKPEAGVKNRATAGDGKHWVVQERPEVSGTDTDQGMDVASAYVTLYKKGTAEKIDTYLVSQWFYTNFTRRQLPDLPQKVEVDGTEYHLYLRSKRTYRDFNLQLLEFRHDKFQGVNVAKNFSSLVRLTDAKEGEDRQVKIWMNHPLHYAGETFYQSGFLPGDRGTILQVVRNPGWLMPYISCAMVAVGMLLHFGLHLVGFLRRRAAP